MSVGRLFHTRGAAWYDIFNADYVLKPCYAYSNTVTLRTVRGLHGQNGPRVRDRRVDDESDGVEEESDVHDAGVAEQSNEVIDDEVGDKLEYANDHVTHSHHQLCSTCNIDTSLVTRPRGQTERDNSPSEFSPNLLS